MCLKPALGYRLSEKTILGDRVGLASNGNEVITHPFELLQMAFLSVTDQSTQLQSDVLMGFTGNWLLLDTVEKVFPKRITQVWQPFFF